LRVDLIIGGFLSWLVEKKWSRSRAASVITQKPEFSAQREGLAIHRASTDRRDLVQTTARTWISHPPTRCPNGHPLGPGQVLVGHQACLGHCGGHTTWTCLTCDQTYGRVNRL